MEDDQQINLKWRIHQSTLISSFNTLLQNGTLVDCTLAAEGKFLKAHKLVLSACSPYFAALLDQQFDKHPIFILKDIKFYEINAIMDYMYRGEMNVDEDLLPSILKAADSLKIKGLTNISASNASSESPAHSAVPPVVSLNSRNTAITTESASSSNAVLSRTVPPPRTISWKQQQKRKREMKAKNEQHLLVVKLDPDLGGSSEMEIEHGKEEKFLKPAVAELLPKSFADHSNYICRRCNKSYISLTSFSRHKRVECNKNPAWKCPHCSYKSKYSWNLKRHIIKNHPNKFSSQMFEAIVQRKKKL